MNAAANTTRSIITLFSIFHLFFPSASAPAQGPLTPPGAPAPTMKTLDQVEPRTPISQADMPFTISKPGSYYLTTNLSGVAGRAGITINASDATLDLNGFALTGAPGSFEGIVVPAEQKNIAIRNGTIREWGLHGVGALNADNSVLTDLRALTNGWGSTFQGGLRIGDNSLVKGCLAEGNQDDGIFASFSSMVIECTARSNGDDGILASRGSTVRGCTARSNGDDGIFVSAGSLVSECTAQSNGGDGIFADTGSTVSGCTVRLNGGDGILANPDCAVNECTATFNTEDGIEALSNCRVTGNTCNDNAAGIHALLSENRIEGNIVMDNDRGLDIDGINNYVAENTVRSNTDNYDIVAGNQLNLLLGEIPETIDWPAMVKLAGTLTGTSGNDGIQIYSSDVTIDLDGHALVGVPGSVRAILVVASQHNIVIRDGIIRVWGSFGVHASNADNSLLMGLRAFSNGWDSTLTYGLRIGENSQVKTCVAEANQNIGIGVDDGSIVSECTVQSNGGDGIISAQHSLVRDCVASFNGRHGILAGSNSRIADNVCTSNGFSGSGAGIRTIIFSQNIRIDGNHVIGNDWGLHLNGTNHLVIQNSASLNSTNYNIAAGNSFGPIANVGGVGDISGTPNADHPWANFEH